MNKPYSDEMLKLDFIEDELANVRPDEDEKYQHKLDELLDKQDGYHKYETVTELKIDSNTTPPELIRFGELLETMSGPLKISVDYRQLKVERERSIKDRIADVCTSERYQIGRAHV